LTVYGDIFFIINFCMDFLALYITGNILRLSMRFKRVALASAVGGVYSVITLIFTGNHYISLAITFAAAAFMCFTAFGYGNIKHYLMSCILFLCVSFLLGGAMTAIFNLLNSAGGRSLYEAGSKKNNIPFWLVAILAAISAGISLLWGKLSSASLKKRTASVHAVILGREAEFVGMVDTGNLLIEPISRRPVIFAGRELAEKLLSCPADCITSSDLSGLDSDLARRVRIVPFEGASGKSIIMAIIPDSIMIDGISKDACIGFDYENLKGFDGYPALLPAALIS